MTSNINKKKFNVIKDIVLSLDIGGTNIKYGFIVNYKILLWGQLRIFSEISVYEICLLVEFLIFLYNKNFFIVSSESFESGMHDKRIFYKKYIDEYFNPFFVEMTKKKKYIEYFNKILNINIISFENYLKNLIEKIFINSNSFFILSNFYLLKNLKEKNIKFLAISSPGFCNNIDKLIESVNPNLPNISGLSFNTFLDLKIHIINDLNAQGYYYIYLKKQKNYNDEIIFIEDKRVKNENFKLNFHKKYFKYSKDNKNRDSCDIIIAIGSGIGGALIINDKIFEGFNGYAGEIGHTIIDKKSDLICGCGKKGCAETFSSARSLIKSFEGKFSNGEEILNNYFSGTLSDTEVKTVDEWINSLAILTGNIINIFNPSSIVYSGALIVNFPNIIKLVYEKLKYYTFEIFLKDLNLAIIKEGKIAGIFGSYLNFIEKEKKFY
ncbi:MAG: ROK family protein [Spirochaetes bacterium]|nr:ROK family protein [Spirochaetota bacterium]